MCFSLMMWGLYMLIGLCAVNILSVPWLSTWFDLLILFMSFNLCISSLILSASVILSNSAMNGSIVLFGLWSTLNSKFMCSIGVGYNFCFLSFGFGLKSGSGFYASFGGSFDLSRSIGKGGGSNITFRNGFFGYFFALPLLFDFVLTLGMGKVSASEWSVSCRPSGNRSVLGEMLK